MWKIRRLASLLNFVIAGGTVDPYRPRLHAAEVDTGEGVANASTVIRVRPCREKRGTRRQVGRVAYELPKRTCRARTAEELKAKRGAESARVRTRRGRQRSFMRRHLSWIAVAITASSAFLAKRVEGL
ncbi:hypothetical protein HPB50_028446 [Hyalomma asiaticum]|nr:hypothetical protein HPB50_028446 [Hyalomma asiaticum]